MTNQEKKCCCKDMGGEGIARIVSPCHHCAVHGEFACHKETAHHGIDHRDYAKEHNIDVTFTKEQQYFYDQGRRHERLKNVPKETAPNIDNDAIHDGLDRLYGTAPKEELQQTGIKPELIPVDWNKPEPLYHQRTERIAMNIVHQIGDLLYETLPPDVAHVHFVTARQATNDQAIDFAKRLIDEVVAEKGQAAWFKGNDFGRKAERTALIEKIRGMVIRDTKGNEIDDYSQRNLVLNDLLTHLTKDV